MLMIIVAIILFGIGIYLLCKNNDEDKCHGDSYDDCDDNNNYRIAGWILIILGVLLFLYVIYRECWSCDDNMVYDNHGSNNNLSDNLITDNSVSRNLTNDFNLDSKASLSGIESSANKFNRLTGLNL